MCGIIGFNWADKRLVKKMTSRLNHRGPDDEGYFIDKNISLGHKRLKIIDLTKKGRQPMSNENKSIWVVFNGEIYNFRELRQWLEHKGHRFYSETDTEVIVHMYEEVGERCVDYFNGCFAFAIWDSVRKRVFIARDRLGINPLYYTFQDGKFIFASEIKAILEDREIKRELNKEAFNTYFTFRANTDAETFFKGIFKVKPGHYLIFDGKRLFEKRYWALKIDTKNKSLKYYEKKVRKDLTESIKRRLMGEVSLGVYLSGGIDSASVVGLLHSFAEDRIKTFSVGFGYEEQKEEMRAANFIANHFNTDHHVLTVKPNTVKLMPKIVHHLDEPMADPTSIPTYILSEFTKKKGVTIVLTGEGSDEIFSGYEQYKLLKMRQKFLRFVPRPFKAVAPFIAKNTPPQILNKFFKYAESLGEKGIERFGNYLLAKNPTDAYLEIISIFNEKEKRKVMKDYNFRYNLSKRLNFDYSHNKNDALHKLMLLEVNTAMVEDLLMKVDKNTMAHAIEARVPFLDHTFVESVYQIPIQYKMKGLTDKYVLRKAMEGILPKQSTETKKKRFFVPIDQWMNEDLKDYVGQLLDINELRKYGVFNPVYIEKMKKGLNRSRLFYMRQLWCLLNFKMWYDQFILGEKL
ncbi:MAG: asparagine synthase (glutamine-hydrolyzing) [Nanoarchaeota archaeon]|nr:asparagine synthase (glutamine-hydrolyzing) [Nanoarchaeota archaeon]